MKKNGKRISGNPAKRSQLVDPLSIDPAMRAEFIDIAESLGNVIRRDGTPQARVETIGIERNPDLTVATVVVLMTNGKAHGFWTRRVPLIATTLGQTAGFHPLATSLFDFVNFHLATLGLPVGTTVIISEEVA